MSRNKPDLLIIGTGIFGLTIAERMSSELGKNVLVIDKRDHIGGNCYSEFDTATGIECHKYGAHLFHTSDERVWTYVNRFTDFTNYVHRVYTTHNDEVFPMPINLGTINQFFRKDYTPDEARHLIAEQAGEANSEPKNLAEQGVALIGQPLFDAFVKNYTAKQWRTPAEELSADIIRRLPVRYNYDNRYFNNTYEGLPTDGYEKLFQNMIDIGNSGRGSVEVRLDTDYFDIQDEFSDILTIFTGPIDQFYDYQFGELKWRSLDLQKEVVDVNDFQGCPVMNYADLSPEYTRIHEFKHFHPERRLNSEKWPGYAEDYDKTVIVREYSKTWSRGDEPYYPVNTTEDREKLAKYQELANQDKNIIFGGRLGEYAYYDMDKTFASALELFDKLRQNGV
ncbi:UDP-galactopyranose mutase [Alphaproteobacteria bacterium]|nr:UDP-galactopyranose mutase [Alphaproteobacteria bacterium]